MDCWVFLAMSSLENNDAGAASAFVLFCAMLSAVFWWGFAFSPERGESCGWYS